MRYWNSLSLTIRAKGVKNKMGAYIFLFTVFPNNDIIFKFIHTITVVPGVKEGHNIKDSMNLTEMRCILHKNSSRNRNVNL